ncbi:hypothetical protein B0H63DRAFT_560478 [Podospora didyma]|uniref:Uncharacterized protein n=1 Tax=Podospora didyma TaxID=330526 RepID=A0AAE0U065_9PEZI|nr:hypothetical protein B0H63DRAFT_560478 [Podospora didyma]
MADWLSTLFSGLGHTIETCIAPLQPVKMPLLFDWDGEYSKYAFTHEERIKAAYDAVQAAHKQSSSLANMMFIFRRRLRDLESRVGGNDLKSPRMEYCSKAYDFYLHVMQFIEELADEEFYSITDRVRKTMEQADKLQITAQRARVISTAGRDGGRQGRVKFMESMEWMSSRDSLRRFEDNTLPKQKIPEEAKTSNRNRRARSLRRRTLLVEKTSKETPEADDGLGLIELSGPIEWIRKEDMVDEPEWEII